MVRRSPPFPLSEKVSQMIDGACQRNEAWVGPCAFKALLQGRKLPPAPQERAQITVGRRAGFPEAALRRRTIPLLLAALGLLQRLHLGMGSADLAGCPFSK